VLEVTQVIGTQLIKSMKNMDEIIYLYPKTKLKETLANFQNR